MESLRWVDITYTQKHKDDDPTTLRPMYYDNLRMYSKGGMSHGKKSSLAPLKAFAIRYGKRTGMALAVYILSHLPLVGRFVLPCASFYTFNKAVGLGPAAVVFGTGLVLPKKYLIVFLQSYFASRSLMRELVSHECPTTNDYILTTLPSLSRISAESNSLLTRNDGGSSTEMEYYLDLQSGSIL